MKRIGIILEEKLTAGTIGNVAAILMGQAACLDTSIYAKEVVLDRNEQKHAAILYSTIVLKAKERQIVNFSQKVLKENPSIICIVFSQIGQKFHNLFAQYEAQIRNCGTEETGLAGCIIIGEEEEVRRLTKKFSLLK